MTLRLFPAVGAVTLAVTAALGGCHSATSAVENGDTPTAGAAGAVPEAAPAILPEGGGPGLQALPRAAIYRTSAPADSLVPVTVTGGRLVSFPSPADIRGIKSAPRLADGWLLDVRGINPHTRFTSWTYSEYAALPSAPSPSEIMARLVPGITVTRIATLPFAVGSVTPEQADSIIRGGLKGCTVTYNAQ